MELGQSPQSLKKRCTAKARRARRKGCIVDGLCEIVPSDVLVEIGGRQWWVGPLRLADYAEIERRVLQQRLLPNATGADRATCDQIDAWLRSDEGILFE